MGDVDLCIIGVVIERLGAVVASLLTVKSTALEVATRHWCFYTFQCSSVAPGRNTYC
jgi:hypothetical protein